MRVLVTGASGFIGRHVVTALREREHEVVALARHEMVPARAGVTPLACDLADTDALRSALARARPEACVHLAWYTHHPDYWHSPANLDHLTHGATLLKALHEHGCRRFVGGGTCAEYDWSVAGVLDERETVCRPRTLYGAAKLALCTAAERYAATVGMSFAWARYHFVYGPGERPERLVPSALAAFSAGRDLACSDGTRMRDFLHVFDAAAATVAILESEASGPINVASGRVVALSDVLEKLAGCFARGGRPRFGARAAPPDDPPALVPSVERLTSEVGWRPSIELDDGLRTTVTAWVDVP